MNVWIENPFKHLSEFIDFYETWYGNFNVAAQNKILSFLSFNSVCVLIY